MEKDYSDSSGQEINLSEILRSLWASKLLIISITFLFALSSVIYAIKTRTNLHQLLFFKFNLVLIIQTVACLNLVG